MPLYDLQTMWLLIPAILITLYAQSKVKSTFQKYLRVTSRRGYSGYDVARGILDQNGLGEIGIELSKGSLSDHYDPRNRVVRLSPEVYQGRSLASVAVAAHEVGHAQQHAGGYVPLVIRNKFVLPIASFGSKAAWIFIFGGLIFQIQLFGVHLLDLGIILFAAAVLFQVITLPVEFNASSRALAFLGDYGYVEEDELPQAKKVLSAAAFTYVAAMVAAVFQLLRLIMIRNRR